MVFELQGVLTLTMNERFNIDGGYIGMFMFYNSHNGLVLVILENANRFPRVI